MGVPENLKMKVVAKGTVVVHETVATPPVSTGLPASLISFLKKTSASDLETRELALTRMIV